MSCGTSSIGAEFGIEIALQRDVEAFVSRAGAVERQVQRLLDQRVEVGDTALAGAAARMQQHAGHDAVGAPPVLGDLRQIGGQGRDQLVLLGAGRSDRVPQLLQQLAREFGKVVHKVERVLDLVGDAGGELAQGRHLLGMDQIGLRLFQLLMRDAQVALAPALLVEQLGVAHGERRLGGKGLDQADDLLGEFARLAARDDESPRISCSCNSGAAISERYPKRARASTNFGKASLPLAKEVADLRRRAGDRRGADGSFAEADRRRPAAASISAGSAPWLLRNRNSRAASSNS